MNLIRLAAIGAAMASFAVIGCAKNESQAGQDAAAPRAAVFAVTTTRSVRGQINDYLDLSGDVETSSSVDVFADTMGRLTSLAVRVGERVAKDQVIAEVDPSRPGSTFVPSPVRAPIAGTITALPNQIGATIAQGVPVARVAVTDLVQIRTQVAERFISRMRVGLNAVLTFEAYPDSRFAAVVSELSPVVDPASRTLGVKLRLARADARIKAGMFAAIRIITESKAGVVKIPVECLVRRFGETYVFVVEPSAESESGFIARRVPVTPGIQIDEKLEIVHGLAPDQEVVIQGQTLLEDNSPVRVVSTVRPLESADRVR